MKFTKNRMEAFSDGVIAIIITIMVLSIPLPEIFTFHSVMALLSSIFIFFVSFIVVGSHWIKHQYMFSLFSEVSNKVIWRNILFLFFLSLMPLFTKWVMQNPTEVIPAIGYDIVFLLVSASNHFLFNTINKENKENETVLKIEKLRNRKNESKKTKIYFTLMVIVIIAIFVLSFFYPQLSIVFFIGFPVLSSLLNISFEYEHRFRKNHDKKIDS